TGIRYLASGARAAERAREKVLAALQRLENELGGERYLAGGQFSVADLTAASLLYPIVLPPESESPVEDMPASVESFRAGLRDRPGYRWVQEMFRLHRRPHAQPSAESGLETQPPRQAAASG